MPYTTNAYENLMREGYHRNSVYKTGNPIFEVIRKQEIDYNIKSIEGLDLDLGNEKFVLVTCHRSENVDDSDTLHNIFGALNIISRDYKVIVSLHPRTRSKIDNSVHLKNMITNSKNIILSNPFSFSDFVRLEYFAELIVTDSGTVQEEACIFLKPCLVIRNSTERPETIESGASILVGNKWGIIDGYERFKKDKFRSFIVPDDYLVNNVSDTVVNILLGK